MDNYVTLLTNYIALMTEYVKLSNPFGVCSYGYE